MWLNFRAFLHASHRFFLSSYETNWATWPLAINSAALALVVIPKLDSMHKVRLFKINSD